MIFDEITIVTSGILILLAITTSFLNPFFRWNIKKGGSIGIEENFPNIDKMPPVSIIVTAHDNSQELEKHLPTLLTQNYNAEYQVVIVAELGDSETEDILKRYSQNKHLYTTFIPNSSRYMSRKKLAITIGVKAAKHEWIIITDAYCSPISDEWLKTMARNFNEKNTLVIGYSGYEKKAKPFYRYERLRSSCYLMEEALRSTAYRTNGTNLAFRKSIFMNGNGYQGNLNLIRGEYDFIVNKYAINGKTAVEISPKVWIRDDYQSKEAWYDKHIFYMETRKYLQRSFAHRCLYNIDMLMMYINYIVILLAIAYSIITQKWIISITAGIALLVTILLRVLFAQKTIKRFDEQISLWQIIPFEFGLIWSSLINSLRYKRANKYDFTSHKL